MKMAFWMATNHQRIFPNNPIYCGKSRSNCSRRIIARFSRKPKASLLNTVAAVLVTPRFCVQSVSGYRLPATQADPTGIMGVKAKIALNKIINTCDFILTSR
jgi:hypothetical protein